MHEQLDSWLSSWAISTLCCRILHCDKENLCGAPVDNQKDCIFLISCVYLRSIQYPNFLHSNDLKSHLLQNSDFFVWCYNGNTRLNYLNPRLTWFTKSQAISCQLDFNSLHPHARTICYSNDTSHNVTGFSKPNAFAQFPQAIPYLIISDHYWFSI